MLGGNNWRRVAIGAALAAAAGAASAIAQEHPDPPKKKEHPEHPAAKEEISKEALGAAVRGWIDRDVKLKGGHFLVWDGSVKRALVLALDKVHDDKLAKVGPDTYFACADFRAEDGTVYDLDVFMKGKSEKSLEAVELSIHKENGKERYGWQEQEGVWKKVTR